MADWTSLQQDCLHCQKCALHETRHNVVFGVGNPASPVMLIGKAPANRRT